MRLQVSETYELVHGAELLGAETAEGEQTEQPTDNQTNDQNKDGGGSTFNWPLTIVVVALFVLIIGWLFLSGRKNRARDKEYVEQIDAIRPGNKVKSRGGLCGIVVEVCDDNTVIIETGSEASGKSHFKLMKECIFETDAKGPTQLAREEAELRRKAEKEAKLAAKEDPAPETPETSEPSEAPEKPEEAAPERADGAQREETKD